MKNKILIFLIFTSIIACNRPQNKAIENADEELKNAIVLMNPTVANIKTIEYLTKNKILDIDENSKFIGFYHEKQKYNFAKSKEYAKDNNFKIKFVACNGKLQAKNIYTTNDCCQQFESVFKQSKGVFFFGGPDIPAECFGEKTHLMSSISDPYRHFFELSFMFHLIGGTQDTSYSPLLDRQPNYVIVGFCLGMQTMNCAGGGTMVQDIPMEIYDIQTAEDAIANPTAMHSNYNSYFDYDDELTSYVFHKIKSVGQNALSEIIENSQPYVLSAHHQSVEKVGRNMEIAATSLDGKVIEATVSTKYAHVIGLQFHPEHTSLYNDRQVKIGKNDTISINYSTNYAGVNGKEFHLKLWKTISSWLKW